MKKLFNSILLVFTLIFASSFVAPPQVLSNKSEKILAAVSKDRKHIYIYTLYYHCDGTYIGAHVDIYDSGGNIIKEVDYDQNDKTFLITYQCDSLVSQQKKMLYPI